MKLKLTETEIDALTQFIDFYHPGKDYEKKMYQLYVFALEHESFDEINKFDRAEWFYFIQVIIGVCETISSLRERILKMEDEALAKLKKVKT